MANRPEIKPNVPARKREWYIDTDSGELRPEVDPVANPAEDVRSAPEPVPAARWTSD
jgi:hypothetical protein